MKNLLSGTIDSIKDDGTILGLDEAKIKSSVVLKILANLGWDTSNLKDVVPEHNIGGRWVDFALISSGKPQVFIEVKKPSINNLELHEKQLLEYSFKEGVKLAVLTKWVDMVVLFALTGGKLGATAVLCDRYYEADFFRCG